MSLSFFSMTSYLGAKSFRVLTPNPFLGRSIIWPIEARTSKSRPKNFSIVFAFAGDSTITSFFAINLYHRLLTYYCVSQRGRDTELEKKSGLYAIYAPSPHCFFNNLIGSIQRFIHDHQSP